MAEAARTPPATGRLLTRLGTIPRVAILAARKFTADHCLSSASVIAYSLIVSLVPLLTVGFSLFSAFTGLGARKRELFLQAERFLEEQGVTIDLSPFFQAIDSLTSNAASVGGIGLLVVIFSATAILRTLEQSFNAIWQIRRPRNIVRQVVFYWAALTLGPLLLTTGISLFGILEAYVTKPTLREVRRIGDSIWFVGDRGSIFTSDLGLTALKPRPLRNVDLGRQVLLFAPGESDAEAEGEEGTPGGVSLREVPQEDRTAVEATDQQLARLNYRALHPFEKQLWLLSEEGIVLRSTNLGESWKVMRFFVSGTTQKYVPATLTDLTMTDERTGFITGRRGLLLRTTDGGATWKQSSVANYDGARQDVSSFDDINRIAFRNAKEGIAVCNRGTFLVTLDGGQTWVKKGVAQARVDRSYADLLDVSFNEAGQPYVAGGLGLVLFSQTDFKNWKARRAGENVAKRALHAGKERLLLVGDADRVLFSADAGQRWQRSQLGARSMESVFVLDGRAIAVGENESVYVSTPLDQDRISWKRVFGGANSFFRVLNVVLPFLVIWVMFIVGFVTLPNTHVPIRPAAVGASVTSAVWVLFILGFIFYVRYFSGGTQAIYGALAAIPLFLLMIYSSAIIVLYGAEITCILQSPAHYLRPGFDPEATPERPAVLGGLRLLLEVFRDFERGRGPTKASGLTRYVDGDGERADHVLHLFQEKGILLSPSEGMWAPAKAGRLVTLEEAVEVLEGEDVASAIVDESDPVVMDLQRRLVAARDVRAGEFRRVTLAELVGA